MAQRFDLAHPPLNRLRGELPAIVEPSLRDMPEFIGFDVGDVELVDSERGEPDDRLSDVAREVTMADDHVRELIGEQRFAFIGVGRRDDDKDQNRIEAVAVAYLYDDARALEVQLAGEEGDLRVVDASLHDYQPPPSDDEIERAIELARRWRGVGDLVDAEDEAMALLVSDVEPGDRHYGTRRIFVGFGPADERLPRVSSIVDLGSETIVELSARAIKGHGGEAGS